MKSRWMVLVVLSWIVVWFIPLKVLADNASDRLAFSGKTIKTERGNAGDFALFCNGRIPLWNISGANVSAVVQLEFARPTQVKKIQVNTVGGFLTLNEAEISPDGVTFRPLLSRWINLPSWEKGGAEDIAFPPGTVGKYLRLHFRTGMAETVPTGLRELKVFGQVNRPERHLMCWANNLQQDYLERLDYFEKDFGATDLWLDFVETAFPQTNPNLGLNQLEKSGLLKELQKRRINYWLGEHESFGQLVQRPEDLKNDQKWETTLREMRRIYAQANRLGFRGIIMDAEDYDGVPEDVKKHYEKELNFADFTDCWCFKDEFGYSGLYYQRGLAVGKILQEVWSGVIFMQVYEARMYAGKNNCRDGNYWWLKGIHDGGVQEIWIASEKTYGAGHDEMFENGVTSDFLTHSFVKLPEYTKEIHQAYPFVTRFLPGFHPWNRRLERPMYLPKYFKEQLDLATAVSPAYWIYTEGNSYGGDPRKVLDREKCRKLGVTPEQYLDILKHSPTSQKY